LAIIQNAFSGIRVAVVALIITTIIKLWKNSVKDWLGIVIAVSAFISTSLFNLSPIYVVVSAAIVGFISKFFGGQK
jgi:chromate transporter